MQVSGQLHESYSAHERAGYVRVHAALRSFRQARVSLLDATLRISDKATKAKQHVEAHAGCPLKACRNTVAPTRPQLRAMGTCGLLSP